MAIEYKLSYTGPEIDEKLGKVDEKLNNSETTYAIELSDELMPSTITWSGTGWTQTEGGGFAHTVGSTEPLTITLSEGTG